MKTLKDLSKLLSFNDLNQLKVILNKLKASESYQVYSCIDNEIFICEDFYYACLDTLEQHASLLYTRDTIFEKASDNLPLQDGHYVYFLINDQSLVYIGETQVLLNRIQTHKKDKTFNKVFCVAVKDAYKIELLNIRHHNPFYNIKVYSDYEYTHLVCKEALSYT